MEFLVALAPIALILLLCGGMHFFMMRGMHGGHEAGHGVGSGSADPDRVAQLENQVRRLQLELETHEPVPRSISGQEERADAAAAVGSRGNGAHGDHSGSGSH